MNDTVYSKHSSQQARVHLRFDSGLKKPHVPNLTPLIDIVFLLLVFFMLTSQFIRDESIRVELPDATHSTAIDSEDIVRVAIDKNRAIHINGELTTTNALQDKLTQILLLQKEKAVIIEGDKNVTLDTVVQILDKSKAAGAISVDILTETQP